MSTADDLPVSLKLLDGDERACVSGAAFIDLPVAALANLGELFVLLEQPGGRPRPVKYGVDGGSASAAVVDVEPAAPGGNARVAGNHGGEEDHGGAWFEAFPRKARSVRKKGPCRG